MRGYQQKWERGQAALYKVFRKYVPIDHEIPLVVRKLKEKNLRKIEVLDIGGGEGSFSLQVIDGLQEAGVKVTRWDALDVSKEQLDSFKDKVSYTQKPEFSFHLQGWNEFVPGRQYDFILARHSWYGVNRWREEPRETNALMKLYKATKRKGIALVVLGQEGDVLFSVPNDLQGDTKSKDVCKALERLGIKFHCQTVKRPLSALLEGGELTSVGHGIFRYMLHTEDISSRKTEIEECLAKWFARHKEWFTHSIFIWIEK